MMLLAFGDILIRITGDATAIQPVQAFFRKYEVTGEKRLPDAVLQLETETFSREGSTADGWIRDGADERRILYFSEGKVIFSLTPGTEPGQVTVCVDQTVEYHMRLGIQFGMMMALCGKCIGLHGVTLLCENQIVILSAPSGTGKTTLAGLLEKNCDAIAVNGDFALLRATEEGVVYEPTPFCGSSGRSVNQSLPVHRVVFLSQSKENEWGRLNGHEAMKLFMSNTFVPTWDKGRQQTVQETVIKCMSRMKLNTFAFAPTKEAAEEFVRQIRQG